jgi:predicted MFS family arabinose efflux permease
VGRAQASSLYNLFYYGGSSVVGWFGGVAFDGYGWTAVATTILVLALIAATVAALFLPGEHRGSER